jgi:glycerophosphoryl diester phosphodiesterase
MKKLFFLSLAFLFFACDNSSPGNIAKPDGEVLTTYFSISEGELPSLMQPGSRLMPLISAHRGGRNIPGHPENSLELFQFIADRIPAMLECDISMCSDGELILMHDNSLDRTTTGSGAVKDKTWQEISQLYLVDDFGETTEFRVPSLEKTLQWAKGKAILSLDVKRGVPFKNVIDLVEEYEMEDYVVVITYTINDALTVHRLNENVMISVSIRNEEEWLRMKTSGIPYNRLVAFTGTRLSPKSLFETLHEENIPTILGTLGNLDKQAAAQGDEKTYGRFLDLGADILATDRPLEAGKITEARKKK